MGGKTLPLTREISVVGRSRECDIRIHDPAASRRHFQVERREGGLQVRDLGSSNGTYRNGRRVQGEERLRNGDVLLVGETEITVRIRGSTDEVEEAPSSTTRIPELADGPPAAGDTPSRGIPASAGRDAKTTVSAPLPPPPGEGGAGEGASEASSSPGAEEEPESVSALLPPLPPRQGRSPAAAREAEEPEGPGSPEVPPSGLAGADSGTGSSSPEGDRDAAVSRGAPRRAGFWIRLVALLVDGIAIAVVSWLVAAPFGGSVELVLSSIASLVLGVGVPVVGWARWGTTPGKLLFGLWVCQENGEVGLAWSQAVIRWIGYLASGIPLGIGFLMVAFGSSKRGLHDRMAGTYVGRR